MLELYEWFNQVAFPPKPWLLLGKGPTFDRRSNYRLDEYNLLGLNHVVAVQRVDVAHIIDIDVVAASAAQLEGQCTWLVMLRYPSVRFERGRERLEDYFVRLPVLKAFAEAGRLVWYNLVGTPDLAGSPLVGAKYFSSEAALDILARMGVTTVRSLGIDGGRTYATAFKGLESSTLLANGQPVFDLQDERLETIAAEHGLDFRPLVEPFRIFIGTDESQIVAHRVLEYSIQRSATVPVKVTPMLNLSTPMPRNPANRPRVSFSFSRFHIPALCGYEGRALYLDADMLVFGDVAELYDQPFDGNHVLCTYQSAVPEAWKGHAGFRIGRHTAVMLLDCSRLRWDIAEIVKGLDEGRFSYEELMSDLCLVEPTKVADRIPVSWNHLEHFEPGVTKLLHFTVVPQQPWKSDDNPLGELWMSCYREAVEAGAVPPEEVEALIVAGAVKSSLAPALRLAPSRRAILTAASLDLVTARHRIAELERRLQQMERSWPWRIGNLIVYPYRRLRTDVSAGHWPALGRRRHHAEQPHKASGQ